MTAASNYNPPGIRGDAPARAARYWGLTQQEYYKRADVWPLAPDGEILVVIQCEETRAIENLPKILKEVPGIGVVLIGEGDLSQELGYPRDYEHPVVAKEINRILAICKEHNVPCGHPHPDAHNIEPLAGLQLRHQFRAALLRRPGSGAQARRQELAAFRRGIRAAQQLEKFAIVRQRNFSAAALASACPKLS